MGELNRGGRIINSWDVRQVFQERLPTIDVENAGGFQAKFVLRTPDLVARKKKRDFETWEAAVAAAGLGNEWVTPRGARYASGIWLPKRAIAISKELGLWYQTDKSETRKDLTWSPPGRPCEQYQSGDYSSGTICGKPATGEATRYFGKEMIPACGLHVGAHKRKAANAAIQAERMENMREGWRRDAETKKANTEALERLRPKLTELGIHPDTVTLGRSGIEMPAEAVERLVEMAIEFDQFMRS